MSPGRAPTGLLGLRPSHFKCHGPTSSKPSAFFHSGLCSSLPEGGPDLRSALRHLEVTGGSCSEGLASPQSPCSPGSGRIQILRAPGGMGAGDVGPQG